VSIVKDVLTKGCLSRRLKARLKEIQTAIRILEKRSSASPGASLRVEKRGNTFRYFSVSTVGDTHGEFIRKKNRQRAEQLAQYDYDQKVLDLLTKLSDSLESLLSFNIDNPDEAVLLKMHEGRLKLIKPLITPDEKLILQWMNDAPAKAVIDGNEACFETESGLLVRSKSEILIANMLHQKGIPFQYEKTLKLKGGVVCPDFLCLDVSRRKEILWEHFGRMDDVGYAVKAVRKIDLYKRNGYVLGKNLIATFETQATPLDAGGVKREIAAYFHE